MNPEHRRSPFSVRCDWGLTGAIALGSHADIVIVVDVLSFTTALSVAVDREVDVFPYRWRDESARDFAAGHRATLAVGRSETSPQHVSLSAASIRNASELTRLVLPSPNGSTIVHALAATRALVIGSSLRNAGLVGDWISTHADVGSTVAVIAAGERWPDGQLRPAVEDLWGAGAVIDAIASSGHDWTLAPEAAAARAAWLDVADRVDSALHMCASGRELIGLGFGGDVDIAAEFNQGQRVPVLIEGLYFRGN